MASDRDSLQFKTLPVMAADTSAFQRCSGSIFGTDISQARNDSGHDNFIHWSLIVTASVTYNVKKIVGTQSA